MPIDSDAFAQFLLDTDALFESLILHQKERVSKRATSLDPRLTSDDILNPHDFQVLDEDPRFQYEDGMLNGYIAAHIAWRAETLQKGRKFLSDDNWAGEDFLSKNDE